MIHFVGAGPGAEDLITVRGAALLGNADVVIYTGSLVNAGILKLCRTEGAEIYNSAEMTLDQVMGVMIRADAAGREVVRLHTGDPGLYGAIREQIDELRRHGIGFEVVPGVSSMGAAAAVLETEYTLPGVSQSVIVTRMAGRTPVPESESISSLASHGATMVIFLSAGMLPELSEELLAGGAYTMDTPAALVYKATHPDEKVIRTTVGSLAAAGRENSIDHTALVVVGDFLGDDYELSKLYDPDFETGFRNGEI
ncbi:MAG: precorrin-4 C(11)-methyltransferase [Lachnospiraceae bacterium]|nr:precorrin-4 C(11)-methyltransferase [Lachnospiraceae bacterium]